MTISEQLSFSILSAPVASADRRALSQAWYSALYGAPCKRSRTPAATCMQSRSRCISAPKNEPAMTITRQPRGGPQLRAPLKQAALALPHERRASRLYLARKIAQLAALRTAQRTAATFVLDDSRARVRVLVSAKGGEVRLI